ncbi:MAG TPA: aminoacetone oxidase family FAD-binding enzyme, partial [Leptospiraceae bacterium]|nr:aminoacetone oxidase family FAD-binding enzyme [Leptospiraceae bacterium]
MKQIGIIGGGAAGYFGAIQIGNLLRNTAQVTLLEKGEEPLTKVKISGGGRCNVTHNLFDPVSLSEKYPRGKKELRAAFERFQPQDTIEWFFKRGVELKKEDDGRMFPTTNQSSTIIDCFQKEANRAKVNIQLGSLVNGIYFEENKWKVITKEKEFYFDKLLVATGSSRKVWEILEKLGHTIEKPVPSLFTFHITDERISELQGLSVPNAEVSIFPKGKSQTGPILITHWGLSGPAILKLSAYEAKTFFDLDYKTKIKINWVYPNTNSEIQNKILETKKEHPAKKISSFSLFHLPSRLWESFLKKLNLSDKRWSEISNAEINFLRDELANGIYEVSGKSIFKEEFVTCG